MHHIQFFLLFGTMFLTFHKANGANGTASVNSTSDDSLDDRFNLNFNYGQATGIGKNGGVSQSNAASYGANVGIRRPGGQYQNLYSQTGSQGNSFSSGPGAPLTFANANSRVQPGYAGGNAGAGVLGGRGSAHAGSVNQNIEIPLDIYGTVLLSNLKERNSTKSKNDTTETTTAVSNKDKEPGPLVFS